MTTTADSNIRGIALMIVSMAAFAIADSLVKLTSTTISPAQTLFFLIGGGLVLFYAIAKYQGENLVDVRAFSPVLLLRYVSEIIGMVGMVLALKYVPLSTVGAITQAVPLLVVLGAVLFLGEKVSWRRWTSITVGFLGVLLIVQPGAEGFDKSILWALLALVCLSVRDLTTRGTPPDMASSRLATYTMLAALPFTMSWVFYNGESLFPAHANWPVVITMSMLGAFGYLLLITSLRMAKVSVVMPFRYSRIIFLLILGVAYFNERPGGMVLLGAFLIVTSGIYTMWREQQVKQEV